MRKKRKFPYFLSILIVVLSGTAGWAFYQIINKGIKDILNYFNITNFYIQNFTIVFFIFFFLFLLGFGFKRAIEKILK